MKTIRNISQGPSVTGDALSVLRWAQDSMESYNRQGDKETSVRLAVSYTPPDKPRPGMIVYADGVKWNPGSGEGLYYYTLAGTWLRGIAYAPVNSPTFTGDPKAPTPSPGDNDTSIATTAFVTAAVAAGGGGSQPLDATLTALANYNTVGFLVETAADTFVGRSLAAGTGISITNVAGTAGNPSISVNVGAGLTWTVTQNFATVNATGYQISGTAVVGTRKTGWAAATGSKDRTSFNASNVTLPVLAQHVGAMIDDLIAHGLIGT
jgi:hypothetical protein